MLRYAMFKHVKRQLFAASILLLTCWAYGQGSPVSHPVPTLEYDQVDFLQGLKPFENMTDQAYDQLAQNFKIMFWNVEIGGSHCELAPYKKHDPSTLMYDNLHKIVESNFRPDVLVLAEFRPECWPVFSYTFLSQYYQKPLIQLYKDENELHGIAIFVNKDLAINNISTFVADWTPTPDIKDIEQTWLDYCQQTSQNAAIGSYTECQYYTKHLSIVPVQFQEQWINLLPLHMVEPWTCYRGHFKNSDGLIATVGLANQIIRSKNNPLYCQMQSCMTGLDDSEDCITENLGDMAGTIVFGDFNVPNTINRWPLRKTRPKALKLLKKLGFSPAFSNTEQAYSVNYQDNPLLLDQAHYNGGLKLEYASIIPIPKSDHYPAYFVFSLASN